MAKALERRVAEYHRLDPHEDRGKSDPQRDQQEGGRPGLLAHRRGDDQELACEDAERRHAENRQRAEHQPPADGRAEPDQAANIVHPLRTRFLRGVTDGEEDRRLDQRMHAHVQQTGEIGDRPAQPEGKGHQAHVLDRRVREHPLDVALADQQEGRRDHRQQPEADHHASGQGRAEGAVGQHLATQDRVQRHIEQQP